MTHRLRIGAKLPHSGQLAMRRAPAHMAAELDAAGFDSIWVSDHVVLPHETTSWYPFAADGRPTWPFSDPYLEPMVVLGAVAASTSRAEIGTSVLIAPMRNPVLMAKQAATVDVLSGGRLVLGVGVGWLREEFEALGADFDARGEVLDEWMQLARECWTGTAGTFNGRHYRLPAAIYCEPAPVRSIPLLVGGMSRRALRRAAAVDGWLGQYALDTMSAADVARAVEVMRSEGAGDGCRVVVRVTGAATRLDRVAAQLGGLAAAGATDVIVDVDWSIEGGPARAFETLGTALNRGGMR